MKIFLFAINILIFLTMFIWHILNILLISNINNIYLLLNQHFIAKYSLEWEILGLFFFLLLLTFNSLFVFFYRFNKNQRINWIISQKKKRNT